MHNERLSFPIFSPLLITMCVPVLSFGYLTSKQINHIRIGSAYNEIESVWNGTTAGKSNNEKRAKKHTHRTAQFKFQFTEPHTFSMNKEKKVFNQKTCTYFPKVNCVCILRPLCFSCIIFIICAYALRLSFFGTNWRMEKTARKLKK